jgi:hypothetical protein
MDGRMVGQPSWEGLPESLCLSASGVASNFIAKLGLHSRNRNDILAVGGGADAYGLRYFNPAHDTRVCPMQDGTSSESVIPFKTKLRFELIIFVITFLSLTSGPTCARRRVFLYATDFLFFL